MLVLGICSGLAVVNLNLVYFSFGVIGGIIPCLIWGMLGGDEGVSDPFWKPYLKLIHHWHLGLIIMGCGAFTHVFILGWGLGTAVDDLLFHSFENYYVRKIDDCLN